MNLKTVLFGLAAFASVSAACAQTPGNGLQQTVSPDQYVTMAQAARQMYVAGALDADRIYYTQTKPMFAQCLNGVTLAQATDIVDRSLATLPDYARTAMPIAVHDALLAACNRAGYVVQ